MTWREQEGGAVREIELGRGCWRAPGGNWVRDGWGREPSGAQRAELQDVMGIMFISRKLSLEGAGCDPGFS